ncbi:uncharacterized protein LOC103280090 isoform X4 [Anolis carolinensis]|uniref:uncharacterized protein LOC103280090 isoform X4 n=1 Tax=Anolis carolinensis TaxID=28377 RepID=UPI002F2B848D
MEILPILPVCLSFILLSFPDHFNPVAYSCMGDCKPRCSIYEYEDSRSSCLIPGFVQCCEYNGKSHRTHHRDRGNKEHSSYESFPPSYDLGKAHRTHHKDRGNKDHSSYKSFPPSYDLGKAHRTHHRDRGNKEHSSYESFPPSYDLGEVHGTHYRGRGNKKEYHNFPSLALPSTNTHGEVHGTHYRGRGNKNEYNNFPSLALSTTDTLGKAHRIHHRDRGNKKLHHSAYNLGKAHRTHHRDRGNKEHSSSESFPSSYDLGEVHGTHYRGRGNKKEYHNFPSLALPSTNTHGKAHRTHHRDRGNKEHSSYESFPPSYDLGEVYGTHHRGRGNKKGYHHFPSESLPSTDTIGEMHGTHHRVRGNKERYPHLPFQHFPPISTPHFPKHISSKKCQCKHRCSRNEYADSACTHGFLHCCKMRAPPSYHNFPKISPYPVIAPDFPNSISAKKCQCKKHCSHKEYADSACTHGFRHCCKMKVPSSYHNVPKIPHYPVIAPGSFLEDSALPHNPFLSFPDTPLTPIVALDFPKRISTKKCQCKRRCSHKEYAVSACTHGFLYCCKMRVPSSFHNVPKIPHYPVIAPEIPKSHDDDFLKTTFQKSLIVKTISSYVPPYDSNCRGRCRRQCAYDEYRISSRSCLIRGLVYCCKVNATCQGTCKRRCIGREYPSGNKFCPYFGHVYCCNP